MLNKRQENRSYVVESHSRSTTCSKTPTSPVRKTQNHEDHNNSYPKPQTENVTHYIINITYSITYWPCLSLLASRSSRLARVHLQDDTYPPLWHLTVKLVHTFFRDLYQNYSTLGSTTNPTSLIPDPNAVYYLGSPPPMYPSPSTLSLTANTPLNPVQKNLNLLR